MSATIYFRREFTRGTLAGLTHDDSITFPTADLCVQWARAVNDKHDAGKIDYRLLSWQIAETEQKAPARTLTLAERADWRLIVAARRGLNRRAG